jgi:hypothetical protein
MIAASARTIRWRIYARRIAARSCPDALAVGLRPFSGRRNPGLIREAIERPLLDGAIDTGVEIKGDQLAGDLARKVHGGGDSRRACESMKDLRDCLPARCGKKALVWSRP